MLGSLTSGKPGRNIRRFTMTAPSNLGVRNICTLRCVWKPVGYSLAILFCNGEYLSALIRGGTRKSAKAQAQERRQERRGRAGGSNCGGRPRKVRQKRRWREEPRQNPRICRATPILSRAAHCARPALSLCT